MRRSNWSVLPQVIIFSHPSSPICRDTQEVQSSAPLPFLNCNKFRKKKHYSVNLSVCLSYIGSTWRKQLLLQNAMSWEDLKTLVFSSEKSPAHQLKPESAESQASRTSWLDWRESDRLIYPETFWPVSVFYQATASAPKHYFEDILVTSPVNPWNNAAIQISIFQCTRRSHTKWGSGSGLYGEWPGWHSTRLTGV